MFTKIESDFFSQISYVDYFLQKKKKQEKVEEIKRKQRTKRKQ